MMSKPSSIGTRRLTTSKNSHQTQPPPVRRQKLPRPGAWPGERLSPRHRQELSGGAFICLLSGAEPRAAASKALAHCVLRTASAVIAGRLSAMGCGRLSQATSWSAIACACRLTPPLLQHHRMSLSSAIDVLSRRPRRGTPLSPEARKAMITVAKEEMRTAGHASAVDSTLFDGCTVAVVKVAPVSNLASNVHGLCSTHSCR